MNNSHNPDFCRAAYQTARKQGSPPVVCCRLGGGVIVLETKDGKVRKENVTIPYTACCIWAAKFNVAEEWIAKFKSKAVKIPDSHFTIEKCAETNRVFLLENHDKFPHLRPVKGWKIIGYGKAPWPGSGDGNAVMFEKVTPAEEKENMFAPAHKRFDEGTRIWQHMNKHHYDAVVSGKDL